MHQSVTTCDLCPANAPTDKAPEAGYSTLNIHGKARAAAHAVAPPGAAQIDLCPACGEALAKFLSDRKHAPSQPPAPTPEAPQEHA